MTFFNRRLLLAATAAMALFPGLSLADIIGTYDVEGRNADGSAYTGTATIQPQGGQYLVQWSVGVDYQGIGALTGDILIVNWGDVHPAFYLVMPDGELHGTWADGTALERMLPR